MFSKYASSQGMFLFDQNSIHVSKMVKYYAT